MPFNVAISAPKVFSQFVACELPQTPMSSNDADQTTALHQARLLTTHPKFLECELARDGDGSALDDGAYNQAQRVDWFDGNDLTNAKKRTVLRRKMRQQLKARNRQEAAEAQAPAQEQAQPSSPQLPAGHRCRNTRRWRRPFVAGFVLDRVCLLKWTQIHATVPGLRSSQGFWEKKCSFECSSSR